MSIEPLEPRIAPASVLNFTDIDGDHVTVTASSGDITAATHAAGLGVQIESIDATAAPGADLIVTVGKVHGGNGHVNIGEIDAQGVNLGKVVIPGDLGRILVGDFSFVTPALAALKVRSMGRFGTSTGANDLHTVVSGLLGILRVAGSIRDADIDVSDGNIGRVFIGGSLRGGHDDDSGSILCDFGTIKSVWIGGDLIGGAGKESGTIFSDINFLHVTGSMRGGSGEGSASIAGYGFGNVDFIGGSIIGGQGNESAYLQAADHVTILGSIIGGAGYLSGAVNIDSDVYDLDETPTADVRGSVIGGSGTKSGVLTGGNLGRLNVGGDVVGGWGAGSGAIYGSMDIRINAIREINIGGSLLGGDGARSGIITNDIGVIFEGSQGVSFGKITIGHDVDGGRGASSGAITSDYGSIRSVAIGGSLIRGGDQEDVETDVELHHGTIFALGSIGSITVGGDIIGGDDDYSSAIIARYGSIGSVVVGGSIVAGTARFSASISAGTTLGSLAVHGSVTGTEDFPAVIRSLGTEGIGFPFGDRAPTQARIGSITIGGNITDGLITAGPRSNINSIPNDARIGTVSVGGDWTASNLIAGVSDGGDGRFGNGDDKLIPGGKQSRIESIAIGGNIFGTGHSSGGSAFESHEIGAFSFGGSTLDLNDGGGNDSLSYALGGGGRLIVREL